MSTTNSTPSGSPASKDSNPPTILTPGRKVKALLAQFSDSDSEPDVQPGQKGPETAIRAIIALADRDNEFEEDEDEVRPQGRLATRLLGERTSDNTATTSDISQTIHSVNDTHSQLAASDSSEDEITTARPIRRQFLVSPQPIISNSISEAPFLSRSESPLFFPSPSAMRKSKSPRTQASERCSPSKNSGAKSKFLALVEKHRRERIAREAEEVAKRAAGVADDEEDAPRRARGSSPADDSSENNTSADEAAVKRIQKQARPTRKASKKAIEEMNRETQRMSRNMQLAHQAKTKKKISKDSLLARFNFMPNAPAANKHIDVPHMSTSASSAAASDAEDETAHLSTPPTSPMNENDATTEKHDAVRYQQSHSPVKDVTHLLHSGLLACEMSGALSVKDQVYDFEGLANRTDLSVRMQLLLDYHQNNTIVRSPQRKADLMTLAAIKPDAMFANAPTQTGRSSLPRFSLNLKAGSESDSEIEIVKERGLKRKYAAFETLPKRKAKEMPSHLALRSLAYLMGSDDKSRSINSAQLEVNLRQKARQQALEERQIRIEELKARGVIIQTAEERERDQQEVEDIVERARQEASEIQKREKVLAKKDGTYVKDNLDDGDDDSDDEDFEDEAEASDHSGSEEGTDGENEEVQGADRMIEDEVDEASSEGESESLSETAEVDDNASMVAPKDEGLSHTSNQLPRLLRNARVIQDDDDDDDEDDAEEDDTPQPHRHSQSPTLPGPMKTPQSVPKSARKMIPGLQMSDDLPMGLSQAFAATMAESQTQDQMNTPGQDSFDYTADLPTPNLAPVPLLRRLDSVDLVSDSQPSASQTQPVNVNLLSQSQVVPESPRGLGIRGTQYTPSQPQLTFDLTQDNGYMLSPFTGNRFAESPNVNGPQSTVETVIMSQAIDDSPVLQRRGRLQRGRVETEEAECDSEQEKTAFQVMSLAAKTKKADQEDFNKKKSEARKIVDEAAEESEDEYAGLGGASDDSGDDEENDDDRRMIDEDTQIGNGDEAKLAGLFADRERVRDEQEVSKLLKDLTTGALRRKRGVGDDLDLSDEEDAAARRREAKRREFAKMRRELLKDEAVGKIAEDKKKEAFLRSIEDREGEDDEDDEQEVDPTEDSQALTNQSEFQKEEVLIADSQSGARSQESNKRPLAEMPQSRLNRKSSGQLWAKSTHTRKPATLAEIRESVSFLIEEPDSQAAMVDLGLSDSEEEPEAYVDLDRHLNTAEARDDTSDEDDKNLGDFVVDDEPSKQQGYASDSFKKPELPRQERAPFTERRTKRTEVVDRLSLLRQSSSSVSNTGSSVPTSTKMAFMSSKSVSSFARVPTLLRRATTNSSLGSVAGHENISATGVVTNKTERGSVSDEKEFIRKGNGGKRNAVNYQAERKTLREEKMSIRAGVRKADKGKKGGQGFLGGLFRGDSWE